MFGYCRNDMNLSILFRNLILLPAVVGCSTVPTAAGRDNSAYLQAHLGKSYEMSSSDKGIEARYCPDNTCDVIKAPPGVSRDTIADFAFLYFSKHSSYVVIKDFQKKVTEQHVHETMRKYDSLCPATPPTTKCILVGMAKKFSIELLSSRDDEGEEVFTAMPIQ